MKEEFIKCLEAKGWKIIKNTDNSTNNELLANKTNIYITQWFEFISDFEDIVNETEDKWFITLQNCINSEWKQNDFEKMSLEAADGDDAWTSEIKSFWEKRFVIFMGVSGGYEYYALNTETGEIEHGYGPEFEESEVTVKSFKNFIDGIINEKIEI